LVLLVSPAGETVGTNSQFWLGRPVWGNADADRVEAELLKPTLNIRESA
jgi:hypothetical protein